MINVIKKGDRITLKPNSILINQSNRFSLGVEYNVLKVNKKSIKVIDDLGSVHTLTMTFLPRHFNLTLNTKPQPKKETVMAHIKDRAKKTAKLFKSKTEKEYLDEIEKLNTLLLMSENGISTALTQVTDGIAILEEETMDDVVGLEGIKQNLSEMLKELQAWKQNKNEELLSTKNAA